MTAPMPETMSPREKVELKACPFCGTPDPQLVAYPNNEPDVWCTNSECDGHAVSASAWNRRTALASGSGDHAELARSIGKAIDNNIRRTSRLYSVRTGERRYGVGGQAEATDAVMAIVSPLLAEIAALRAECDGMVEEVSRSQARLHAATEAERKLAEAVGLLSEVADEFGCTIEQYHKNGPHWTSADGEMFDVGVILDREPIIERIRTFLSKEAERG